MNNENRLILMISSPYGARYYNVNLIFKHIIIYFLTFIGSIAFFILIALHTLASEINDIEKILIMVCKIESRLLVLQDYKKYLL